jgi:hypothetical protein
MTHATQVRVRFVREENIRAGIDGPDAPLQPPTDPRELLEIGVWRDRDEEISVFRIRLGAQQRPEHADSLDAGHVPRLPNEFQAEREQG